MERFSRFPGCGEPRLEASVCIYYSQPAISSAGPSFLRPLPPSRPRPQVTAGPGWRPGLPEGWARSPHSASASRLGGEREGNMSAVLGVGTLRRDQPLQDRGLEVAAGSQIHSIGDPELFFWRKIAGSNSGQTVTGKKA